MKTKTATHTPTPNLIDEFAPLLVEAWKTYYEYVCHEAPRGTLPQMKLLLDLVKKPNIVSRAVDAHQELLAIAQDALSVNQAYDAKVGFVSAQTKRLQQTLTKAQENPS